MGQRALGRLHDKEEEASQIGRDWSNVPCDLLEKIGNLINSKHDVSVFRAVCRSWRSSLPHLTQQEQQEQEIVLFPFTIHRHVGRYILYSISESSVVYQLTSSHANKVNRLMVKINNKKGGELRSGGKIKALYPLREQKQQLDEFRVFELAKAYRLYLNHNNESYISPAVVWNAKVVKSNAADWPEFLIITKDEWCRRNSPGNAPNVAQHCKLGRDNKSCCYYKNITLNGQAVVRPTECYLADIIFYEGKFYAVSRFGDALVFDSSSSSLSFITNPTAKSIVPCISYKMNLVESLGELLLVASRIDYPLAFLYPKPIRFFKLDVKEGQWVEIFDLKGQALFLGNTECCFSVSTSDFPGLLPNGVYSYDSDTGIKLNIVQEMEYAWTAS